MRQDQHWRCSDPRGNMRDRAERYSVRAGEHIRSALRWHASAKAWGRRTQLPCVMIPIGYSYTLDEARACLRLARDIIQRARPLP